MELDLDRLPGHIRESAAADQPPAGLFESVVTALSLRPVIFGPGLLPEGVEYRLEGGGAFGGEVAVEVARALEVGGQGDRAAGEPVIRILVGRGTAGVDLLDQPVQVSQVGAASRRSQQDEVSIGTVLGGQPVSPGADLPSPGLSDLLSG